MTSPEEIFLDGGHDTEKSRTQRRYIRGQLAIPGKNVRQLKLNPAKQQG